MSQQSNKMWVGYPHSRRLIDCRSSNISAEKDRRQFSILFRGKSFGNNRGQGYLCHPQK